MEACQKEEERETRSGHSAGVKQRIPLGRIDMKGTVQSATELCAPHMC